jgi:hypothetical protein
VVAFLGFLTAVAGFAMIVAGLAWLARRVRRSGTGGGIMGPIDAIYHPSAHRFRIEIETHEQRMLPLPAPEEPDRHNR